MYKLPIRMDEQTKAIYITVKNMIKQEGMSIEKVIPFIFEEALLNFLKKPNYLKYLNGSGLENRK